MKPSSNRTCSSRGFSLLELLVVIVIIGVVAGFTIPALKGFGSSVSVDSAVRQFMSDLALARQSALTTRSTVLMLFTSRDPEMLASPLTDEAPLQSYALYAMGSVGDQPGRPRRQFLTEWRSLPDGILFDPNKLRKQPFIAQQGATNRALPYMETPVIINGAPLSQTPNFHTQRVPLVTTVEQNGSDIWVTNHIAFPYLAFRPDGGLFYGFDETITLVKGSIFTLGEGASRVLDIIVNTNEPPKRIHINALTGRAEVEPEIFGVVAAN